ncbi:MAG: hypothetical protein R3B09_10765 [Nannocystaceae bacterium]
MTLTGIRGLVGLLAPLLVCHGSSNPSADATATATETSTESTTLGPSTSQGTSTETDTTEGTSMTDTSEGTTEPTSTMTTTATTSMTTSTTNPAPFCGDGNVDGDIGEECDEGDANGEGQACTEDCKSAVSCGDGHAYLPENGGAEECDDGNDDDTDECLSTCVAATCGDANVHAGVEACDDGNDEDLDSCSNNCATARRFVFVTGAGSEAQLFTGALGGLSGADAKCQARADNNDSLPILHGRKFRAWLSDTTVGPKTRFSGASEPFTGSYVMAQVVKEDPGWALIPIATGWSGLASAMHTNVINLDEIGDTGPYSSVWTNTKTDGTPGGGDNIDRHCNDWTSSNNFSVYGNLGTTTEKTANWTAKSASVCGSFARLFCVEDP